MMRRLLLLLMFLLPVIGCSNEADRSFSPDMQAIVDQGAIRIGVQGSDSPPYSTFEEGQGSGFIVAITEAMVDAAFGDAVAIEWVPTVGNRLDSVRAGDIDLDMRQLTHGLERAEDVEWTVPFVMNGYQFLVNADSGISGWTDLANKTVCHTSDAQKPLQAWSEAQGIAIEQMLVFHPGPFIEGECTALFDKWSWLTHWMVLYSPQGEEENQWVTIGDLVNPEGEPAYESIAVAVKPDAPGLYDAINSALIDMINDGDLQEVYDEWLPEQPPWAVEALLETATVSE